MLFSESRLWPSCSVVYEFFSKAGVGGWASIGWVQAYAGGLIISSRGYKNLAVFTGFPLWGLEICSTFCSKPSSENGKWEKPTESRNLRAGPVPGNAPVNSVNGEGVTLRPSATPSAGGGCRERMQPRAALWKSSLQWKSHCLGPYTWAFSVRFQVCWGKKGESEFEPKGIEPCWEEVALQKPEITQKVFSCNFFFPAFHLHDWAAESWRPYFFISCLSLFNLVNFSNEAKENTHGPDVTIGYWPLGSEAGNLELR